MESESLCTLVADTVMAKRSRNDRGANTVDRISNLSRNLIDLILEQLPVHDAARTTILSKSWRNVWVMHPQLVFEKTFFSQLVTKTEKQAQPYEVSTIISNCILNPLSRFEGFWNLKNV